MSLVNLSSVISKAVWRYIGVDCVVLFSKLNVSQSFTKFTVLLNDAEKLTPFLVILVSLFQHYSMIMESIELKFRSSRSVFIVTSNSVNVLSASFC